MSKKIGLIIITVISGITLLIAGAAVTYSWYTSRITSDKDLTIPATGVILISFDNEEDYSPNYMYHAVAMENAVRDNKYIDVLTEYDSSSDNPSYVEKVATVFTYTNVINFTENPVEEVPEGGYPFWISLDTYVINNGVRIDDLADEISCKIYLDINYENEALPDVTGIEQEPNNRYNLLGQARINLTITMNYAKCDEECDPALIGGELHLVISSHIEDPNSAEPTPTE